MNKIFVLIIIGIMVFSGITIIFNTSNSNQNYNPMVTSNTITFTETGIGQHHRFSIEVNNTTYKDVQTILATGDTNTMTITFTLGSGTYYWNVQNITNFKPNVKSGSFISANGYTVSLTYTMYSNPDYKVRVDVLTTVTKELNYTVTAGINITENYYQQKATSVMSNYIVNTSYDNNIFYIGNLSNQSYYYTVSINFAPYYEINNNTGWLNFSKINNGNIYTIYVVVNSVIGNPVGISGLSNSNPYIDNNYVAVYDMTYSYAIIQVTTAGYFNYYSPPKTFSIGITANTFNIYSTSDGLTGEIYLSTGYYFVNFSSDAGTYGYGSGVQENMGYANLYSNGANWIIGHYYMPANSYYFIDNVPTKVTPQYQVNFTTNVNGFDAFINVSGTYYSHYMFTNNSYLEDYYVYNITTQTFFSNYGSVNFTVNGHNMTVNVPIIKVTFNKIDNTLGNTLSLLSNTYKDVTVTGENYGGISFTQSNIIQDTGAFLTFPKGNLSLSYYFAKSSFTFSTFTANGIYTHYNNTFNSSITINIVLGYYLYEVIINEVGLPTSYNWNIYFNNVYYASNTNSISIQSQYGTFYLNVSDVDNYIPSTSSQLISVTNSINVNVTFSSGYTLEFIPNIVNQYNLSIVNQTGKRLTYTAINGNPINLLLKSEKYNYYANSTGYYELNGSLNLINDNTIQLNFKLTVTKIKEEYFNITTYFNKSVSGIYEIVNLSGNVIKKVNLYSQEFTVNSVLNGSYLIYFYSPDYYFNNNSNVNVIVNGHSVYANITIYPYITFNIYESGLPSQTYWFVNVNGSVYSSYSNLIQFRLPDNFVKLPMQIGNVSSFYTTSKITNLTPLDTNYYITFNVISNSPYTVTQFFLKYELYIGILILSSSIVLIAIGLKRRV
jgi:hypothetical protein